MLGIEDVVTSISFCHGALMNQSYSAHYLTLIAGTNMKWQVKKKGNVVNNLVNGGLLTID